MVKGTWASCVCLPYIYTHLNIMNRTTQYVCIYVWDIYLIYKKNIHKIYVWVYLSENAYKYVPDESFKYGLCTHELRFSSPLMCEFVIWSAKTVLCDLNVKEVQILFLYQGLFSNNVTPSLHYWQLLTLYRSRSWSKYTIVVLRRNDNDDRTC